MNLVTQMAAQNVRPSSAVKKQKTVPAYEKSGRRDRVAFTLSAATRSSIDELRTLTDADSDSEVVRNAVRLHLTLLRAHVDGKVLMMKDEKHDVQMPVNLFAEA
jgi:hypothetical protein